MCPEQHNDHSREPVGLCLTNRTGTFDAPPVRLAEQLMPTQAQPRIGVNVVTFGGVGFLASSNGRHEHAPARPGSVSGYRDTNGDFQTDLSPYPPSDERHEEV